MSSFIYAASSSAGIASTDPISRQRKRVDFLTRYCGLSLPTLFKRIGTMAADGQPLPSAFPSCRVRTRRRGAERTDLARQAANPFAGTGLPKHLHRRGSTTGNGWRSPSRQAGPSPPNIAGDNP
jgi:hypothetical protein